MSQKFETTSLFEGNISSSLESMGLEVLTSAQCAAARTHDEPALILPHRDLELPLRAHRTGSGPGNEKWKGREKWRKMKWREVSRGEVDGRKEKMGKVKFSFM